MSDGDRIRIPEQPTTRPVGRLGRHIDHDPRSRAYRAAVAGIEPRTRVWPRRSVFDQGSLGSCTGNALVGVAATTPNKIRYRHYTEQLAVAVYRRATEIDPWPETYPPDDTGSSGLAAAKACVERGLAKSYQWGFGIDDLVRIVSGIGPCAVGTDWHADMDNPRASEGYIVKPTGGVRGGHEYEVIGYHHGAGLLECVNSWGDRWGKHGRFFITVEDMASLLAAGGDCVTLTV